MQVEQGGTLIVWSTEQGETRDWRGRSIRSSRGVWCNSVSGPMWVRPPRRLRIVGLFHEIDEGSTTMAEGQG